MTYCGFDSNFGIFFTQYKSGDWAPVQHLGIQECNAIIKDHVVDTVMECMWTKLSNLSQNDFKGMQDRFTFPGLALFSSDKYTKDFFADIKIYVESCAMKEVDHQFFRFFLKSHLINRLYQECVEGVLGNSLPVKLASSQECKYL